MPVRGDIYLPLKKASVSETPAFLSLPIFSFPSQLNKVTDKVNKDHLRLAYNQGKVLNMSIVPSFFRSTPPYPHARWRRKWQPSPVFLPGESQGQRSLADHSPWRRQEADTTETT